MRGGCSSSPNKSIISTTGDVKKNSEKLKYLLLHIRFPNNFNEQEYIIYKRLILFVLELKKVTLLNL